MGGKTVRRDKKATPHHPSIHPSLSHTHLAARAERLPGDAQQLQQAGHDDVAQRPKGDEPEHHDADDGVETPGHGQEGARVGGWWRGRRWRRCERRRVEADSLRHVALCGDTVDGADGGLHHRRRKPCRFRRGGRTVARSGVRLDASAALAKCGRREPCGEAAQSRSSFSAMSYVGHSHTPVIPSSRCMDGRCVARNRLRRRQCGHGRVTTPAGTRLQHGRGRRPGRRARRAAAGGHRAGHRREGRAARARPSEERHGVFCFFFGSVNTRSNPATTSLALPLQAGPPARTRTRTRPRPLPPCPSSLLSCLHYIRPLCV
jgi:hypothetical protein